MNTGRGRDEELRETGAPRPLPGLAASAPPPQFMAPTGLLRTTVVSLSGVSPWPSGANGLFWLPAPRF